MHFERSIVRIFSVIFLVFYCNPVHCRASPLIGNLRAAHDDEFPFLVSIGYSHDRNAAAEEKNHICGGTLITERHVLTAAHCFIHVKGPREIVVKVGSTDLRGGRSIEVDWYVFYKQWADNLPVNTYHDVAIVKIRKLCKGPKLPTPAILATKQDNEYVGKTATTGGWGGTETDARPRFLQAGEMTVLPFDNCYFNIKQFDDQLRFQVRGSVLCSIADPYVLLASGDSGSPLIVNKTEIIGINLGACSTDKYVPKSKYQNYHASVNYYKKFILDVTRNRP